MSTFPYGECEHRYGPYRKTYEVTGYIDAYGDTRCLEHCGDINDNFGADRPMDPIFLEDEWDSAPFCVVCLALIDCTVIGGNDSE